jgi:hypothetical protein
MGDDKIIPGKLYRLRPDGTPCADMEYVENAPAITVTTVEPDGEKACANCGERPGTEKWVGENGVMGLVHGMYSMWCRICCVRKQLEHAYEVAASIPGLEKELSDLEDQSSTSTE